MACRNLSNQASNLLGHPILLQNKSHLLDGILFVFPNIPHRTISMVVDALDGFDDQWKLN
jgi:hypothetical protein